MARAKDRRENVRSPVSFKASFHDEVQGRVREGSFSSLSDDLRHTALEEVALAEREKLDAVSLARLDDREYSSATDNEFSGLRARINEAQARKRR